MHTPTSYIFAAALAILFSCQSCTHTPTFPSEQPQRSASDYVDKAKHAMVATSHPDATQAGLSMLKQDGNAIDAATAVTFALAVVRPQSTGIGGGGFLMYYNRKLNRNEAFDFRERAPSAATKDMYLDANGKPKDFTYAGRVLPNASINGHLAAGVPGLVRGIVELHSMYGKLPLRTVMAPAISLARNGFEIYPHLANAIASRANVLQAFSGSRKIFLNRDGSPRKVGDTLIQEDLARTLERIVDEGVAGFYSGETARKIIEEIKRGKGIISLRDLSDYKMIKREPVSGTYRGYKIVSMPPPSSGGIHIIQMLNMLESYDLQELKHMTPSTIHLLGEVMRRAFADRALFLGDPDFVTVPSDQLINKSYARDRMKSYDPSKASLSSRVGAGQPAGYESDSTTHFSIVDATGNAVSSTQTINGAFGSGVVVQGTGIVLNNEMDDFSIKPGVPNLFGLVGSHANAVAARKTMLSSMSPTLVFNKDGDLDLVVGSPGGPTIINATLLTIINRIDFALPLDLAVFSYRFHHQWLPDTLYVESRALSDEQLNRLRSMGHKIELRPSIGRVQAVGRSNDDHWIGVADTRGNGLAAGY